MKFIYRDKTYTDYPSLAKTIVNKELRLATDLFLFDDCHLYYLECIPKIFYYPSLFYRKKYKQILSNWLAGLLKREEPHFLIQANERKPFNDEFPIELPYGTEPRFIRNHFKITTIIDNPKDVPDIIKRQKQLDKEEAILFGT